MQAYAVIAKVNTDFADHDWAVENLKEEGKPDDFSTVWASAATYRGLKNYDDAVYFYGGRDAIYKALKTFEFSTIMNHVSDHRDDPIHVFSAVVKTRGGRKQIIMLAVADATRDADLADFRDQALEGADTTAEYRVDEFRAKMKKKWPDIG